MNDRIIAKDRYKKVARKSVDKKKQKISHMYNINGKLKQVKKKRESIFSLTIVKIFLVLLAIFLLGIISKIIIQSENIPIISAFFNNDNNLQDNYELKVGIIGNDSSFFKARNAIVNDIYKISTKRLIKVNTDYTFSYELASNINYNKDSKTLIIELNDSYGISAENVKTSIYKILSNKENIYYNRLQLLSDVKVIEKNKLEIVFKEDNPYYVYVLDFPIYIDEDIIKNVKNIEYNSNINSNVMTFINVSKKTDKNISVLKLNNYSESSEMINEFKNNTLDVIAVSSDSVLKLIGKYDYSMKKYRDGSSLFIFGNKDSNIFKIKEIRQALLYSLNREEIIKSLNNSFLELIDLPYIYSKLSYKYDITAANNVLLSNGWTKSGGIYTKEGMQAILNLLVNSDDEIKCRIAENIKSMAELNGIRINIEKLDSTQIKEKIDKKEFDIILADLIMDETPDISYIKEYINVSESVDKQLKQIDNSDIFSISENINSLLNILSQEVSCIGIYATNTSIIYQKNITGFDGISYMNVFTNIENIGRKK